MSEETKAKISAGNKGKKRDPAIYTEEYRKRMSRINLGRKMDPSIWTEEVRRRVSEAHLGKKRGPHTKEWNEKIAAAQRGKKRGPLSAEQKAKLSAFFKGRKMKPFSELQRLHIGQARKGIPLGPHSEATKAKISAAHKGKPKPWLHGGKSYSWKGGVTPRNEKIRKSLEFKIWHRAVFERDGHTCQDCSRKGGYLNAHHIKEFSKFPEERLNVSNGVTLCVPCHKNRHKKHPLK